MGKGTVLRLPIAHADGRYHTTSEGLAELERNGQVAFRYSTPKGAPPNGSDANPNGSIGDIAGVYNRQKNVLGMMPHPERASEAILGNEDGLTLFKSLRRHLGFE
jgi:phosphoribosylformylglycinamidine synthase